VLDALLDDGLLDFTLLFGSPGKQVRRARSHCTWHVCLTVRQ
jgi:hypothetical protein